MKKTILITGVSKGIGYELAKNLQDIYHVVGISRTPCSLTGVDHVALDLQDNRAASQFVEICQEKNWQFDAVIFNAGVGYFDSFVHITDQQIQQMVSVNLLSPILFLQKLFPFLQKKATIIFMGSVAGKKFLSHGAVYQATKFGLRGLAGALKNELTNRVHIIHPRLVETGFHDKSQVAIKYTQARTTSMESIVSAVTELLAGNETRFEIDL